jgi:hypothetical protein
VEATAVFVGAHVGGDRDTVTTGGADDNAPGVHRLGGERPIVVVLGKTVFVVGVTGFTGDV